MRGKTVGGPWQSQVMENPTTPDPGSSDAAAAVVGQGRWRDYTPLGERSQRMHQFTGRLLAGVADATAGGVDGVAVGCLNAREAGEAVLELGEVIDRLLGLRLRLLAHADSHGVHTQVEGPAATDTAGWLAHRGLLPGRTARAEVRLSGDVTEAYAATGSALLAGDVDPKQAEIIVWAVKRLPQAVDAEVRARAEKHLLEEARRLDAAQLRVAGRRLLEVIDPDAAEAREAKQVQDDEDAAAARTWLTTWDDGEGTTHLSAKIPTRHADMLRKALHNIANPKLSDAIGRTVGVDDPATGETVETEKPGPRVMGEAFCRLIETLDLDRVPHSGGLNAAVVVTVPLETLQGGLATATMDTGTQLSPGEARRMACDAGLHPAVLGGQSEILDYGRKRRLFSAAQRAVMAMRQKFRCAAEGCDRPTAWADAHHLNPWVPDGETNLNDGVMICSPHHRLAHHPDYTVTRQPGWRISITRTPRDTPRRQ
jgi:hypothetical protein